MNRSAIQDAIQGEIVARGFFLVDLSVSRDNDITLTVDCPEGSVTLDDCVALSQRFEELFPREGEGAEDYSLTVSSAGLDQPFLVEEQFRKAVGSAVEVSLKGGKRLTGVLENWTPEGLVLRYTELRKEEGSRKKVRAEVTGTFAPEEINSVRYHIEFE